MIFNEIYSAYYHTVAKIIESLLSYNRDERLLEKIVLENAFSESVLTILPALKSEKWQLMHKDLTTPLKHPPTMPLSTVQKQWLKAISQDPKIKLFGVNFEALRDVEPLFTKEDYCIYDQYSDGDPFCDEAYIKNFRTILSARSQNQPLKIRALNRSGRTVSMTVVPKSLEYSEKDDKFRLIGADRRNGSIINLARILSCEKCDAAEIPTAPSPIESKETVTLLVYDNRNALERTLLHFAHFEKRVEKIGEKKYSLFIKYNKYDETELVIRILSFGPMVEVTEPPEFRNLIIDRLKRQQKL